MADAPRENPYFRLAWRGLDGFGEPLLPPVLLEAGALARDLAVVAVVCVVTLVFLVQPYRVDGSSMEPVLHDNERIFIDKLGARMHRFDRGDVVIFHAPPEPERRFIKRVIGLPGETIHIQDGIVYINGRRLEEPYLDRGSILYGDIMDPVLLGEAEYFVMGDNRPYSNDSRHWGPVPENLMVGRAFYRYWPMEQAGGLAGRGAQ